MLSHILPEGAKRTIQKKIFYNEKLQDLTWALYYTPNPIRPSVPISTTAEKNLRELRERGVTIMPGFEAVADHIQKVYFDPLERRGRNDVDFIDTGAREDISGTTNIRASYKDPGLAPMLFNPDVCGVLYNYYKRQPYYREQPWAVYNGRKDDMPLEEFYKTEVAAKYHTDFYRQITMMLIVNDLTIKDTHLQFAVGSHRGERHPWNRFAYKEEDVEKRYKIFDCVGPKGSLIIMDAGAGLHRGFHVKGTVRKTLQAVVTTGHYFTEREGKMDVSDWPERHAFKDFARKMTDPISHK